MIAKGPKYRELCKVDWDKNLSLLCEAVDQYALQWAKREMVELSVLSSWKEMVKGQIEKRISKLKQNFKQPTTRVLSRIFYFGGKSILKKILEPRCGEKKIL